MDTGQKNLNAARTESLLESRQGGAKEELSHSQSSQKGKERPSEYWSVNYLFATYLQTREGGGHKITRIEKIRPGKARFYFDISQEEAAEVQIRFHNSSCSEFESLRKATIDLAY